MPSKTWLDYHNYPTWIIRHGFYIVVGILIFVIINILLVHGNQRGQVPSPAAGLSNQGIMASPTAYQFSIKQPTQPTTAAPQYKAAVTIHLPPTQELHAYPTITPTPLATLRSPIRTLHPSSTRVPNRITGTPTLAPDAWKSMPIIPTLSERARSIYLRGLAMGNHPDRFSKVGDGEISGIWFLTDFDLSSNQYNLGHYSNLQPVIDYFAGSFGRRGQAARRGFNTSRVLDPSLADPAACISGETPLACEIRINRPSFAIISMGTNQVWSPDVFEMEMRQIINILIDQGVVPILSTKGDNLEGDFRINAIIGSLAYEYDLPLWNFWRAIQSLPEQGMQNDHEHLTYAKSYFNDPANMTRAWPIRNLTALQMLDSLAGDLQVLQNPDMYLHSEKTSSKLPQLQRSQIII